MRRESVGSMCKGVGDKSEHVGEARRAPRFLRRMPLSFVDLSLKPRSLVPTASALTRMP